MPFQKEERFSEESSDPGICYGVLFYFFLASHLLLEQESHADLRGLLVLLLIAASISFLFFISRKLKGLAPSVSPFIVEKAD